MRFSGSSVNQKSRFLLQFGHSCYICESWHEWLLLLLDKREILSKWFQQIRRRWTLDLYREYRQILTPQKSRIGKGNMKQYPKTKWLVRYVLLVLYLAINCAFYHGCVYIANVNTFCANKQKIDAYESQIAMNKQQYWIHKNSYVFW